MGTQDVVNMELAVYLDNGTSVHEFWSGSNFSTKLYSFNSALVPANNLHSIVCVEVVKVNGKQDDVISNNKNCTAITDEFVLIDPFPNPTTDLVSFMFVIPDASNVRAEIFDVRGRLVDVPFDKSAVQGLNNINYNTIKLDKGMYMLRLSYKDQVITKVFVKE